MIFEQPRYQMIVNKKLIASEQNLSLLLIMAKKRWEYSCRRNQSEEHIQVIDTAISFDGRTSQNQILWDSKQQERA